MCVYMYTYARTFVSIYVGAYVYVYHVEKKSSVFTYFYRLLSQRTSVVQYTSALTKVIHNMYVHTVYSLVGREFL